eukprot:scaffold92459_cov21-Tisochrysis_lutea.AAC.1
MESVIRLRSQQEVQQRFEVRGQDLEAVRVSGTSLRVAGLLWGLTGQYSHPDLWWARQIAGLMWDLPDLQNKPDLRWASLICGAGQSSCSTCPICAFRPSLCCN